MKYQSFANIGHPVLDVTLVSGLRGPDVAAQHVSYELLLGEVRKLGHSHPPAHTWTVFMLVRFGLHSYLADCCALRSSWGCSGKLGTFRKCLVLFHYWAQTELTWEPLHRESNSSHGQPWTSRTEWGHWSRSLSRPGRRGGGRRSTSSWAVRRLAWTVWTVWTVLSLLYSQPPCLCREDDIVAGCKITKPLQHRPSTLRVHIVHNALELKFWFVSEYLRLWSWYLHGESTRRWLQGKAEMISCLAVRCGVWVGRIPTVSPCGSQ